MNPGNLSYTGSLVIVVLCSIPGLLASLTKTLLQAMILHPFCRFSFRLQTFTVRREVVIQQRTQCLHLLLKVVDRYTGTQFYWIVRMLPCVQVRHFLQAAHLFYRQNSSLVSGISFLPEEEGLFNAIYLVAGEYELIALRNHIFSGLFFMWVLFFVTFTST